HCSLTSRDIKFFQKKKEEKDKALLSEHHSMRISQALSLMNEMLSETVVLHANEQRQLSRTRLPKEYRRRHVASTKGIWALLVVCLVFCLVGFFSCCRGHLNSPVVSERSRTAAKPSFDQKVHRFTPTLDLTQSRGKNRTF
ncbi:CPLN1 protein, partial [Pandion haliaetus]|nr:CPLN1 protein [Pandion haliaetus]